MMTEQSADIESILERLDEIKVMPKSAHAHEARALSAEQLSHSEAILEAWVLAHDGVPTNERKEGFRLLALHRQGAKGIPSFNACRETCREIIYQHNVVTASDEEEAKRESALRLMTMVVRHLALFVSGKLQVAGLGDFCCASKPLRQPDDNISALQNP